MHCCQKLALILPLLLPLACQDKDGKTEYRYIDAQGQVADGPSESCKPDLQLLCKEINEKIESKQKEIDGLADGHDMPALYAAQLDLNEMLEIRDAYLKGNQDISAIAQRYSALRQIMAANVGDPNAMGAVTYQKEELAAVREVFNELGELTIDPAIVADSANDRSKTVIYTAQESGTPWAAYWYPKRGKEMYEASNSPLAKLDDWLSKQDRSSSAVAWEDDNHDPAAAEWEGLCDAWAMASVSTQEPKKSVKLDGVNFAPSDLKALAIKYYEGYKPKIFGRRYQGAAATDGQIQDLRPEAFHRVVEEYIGKRKQPIIVDEDPGPEVWSKPLFRMAFNVSRDPDVQQALLVKAYPWMTRQRSGVDDAPTSLANDLAAPTYEYRLYYEAKPSESGRLKIIAGEWLNSSLDFHPDMVALPAAPENQNQPNPEIRKHNAEIRKLLDQAGMLKP